VIGEVKRSWVVGGRGVRLVMGEVKRQREDIQTFLGRDLINYFLN